MILLIGLPTFLTHLLFWRIEHRLGLRVYQKPVFNLLLGSIHLHPVSLDWQNYLRVRSGTLKIEYPVASIFTNRNIFLLEGQNLAVEFAPELQKAVGSDRIVFDRVVAKVILNPARKVEIEFLDAESKTIQFHLNRVRGKEKVSTSSI
ncbi:MAG: hypothetical protein HY351_05240 [Candidatus Omnitrophica bacterium]|nr:hypothetical protein [Candidatus Omnitrophota bacterium]